MRVEDIAREIEAIARPETAQDWDNVGLQVGLPTAAVTAVLVCLEMTEAVVAEAEGAGAELIVAHHPLIFGPLAAVTTDLPVGRLIARLLCARVALYVAHTNLDCAPEIGTAAMLGRLLGLRDGRALLAGEPGLGLLGELATPTTVGDLAQRIREVLQPSRLVVVGAPEGPVATVAIMPGSGGDAVVPAARAAADALVCGDLKHHDALEALAVGLPVIDAGHYATERPVVHSLAEHLRARVGDEVRVIESEVNTDPFAGAGEYGYRASNASNTSPE